jgi:hypothetical protein
MSGTSSSGPENNGFRSHSSDDCKPMNSRIPLDVNKWTFKQACKTRRPDGTEAYGVFPLPEDATLHELMQENHHETLSHAQESKRPLRVPEWLSVDEMPSDIHVELLKHGIIDDPNIRDNEHAVQCKYPITWVI